MRYLILRFFEKLRNMLQFYFGNNVNRFEESRTLEPTHYDFLDPEYVSECLVDLESDFKISINKDPYNGLSQINIYFPATENRGISIEQMIEHNERLFRLATHIDIIIEKIKLEYPDFKYYINQDLYGVQIFRVLNNLGQPGLIGLPGIQGEVWEPERVIDLIGL